MILNGMLRSASNACKKQNKHVAAGSRAAGRPARDLTQIDRKMSIADGLKSGFARALQKAKEKARLRQIELADSSEKTKQHAESAAAALPTIAPYLLPVRKLNLVFISAIRVVFTVPITEKRVPLHRDYVCYLFNLGRMTIFGYL